MVQNTARRGQHPRAERAAADFRCVVVEQHADGMLLRIDGREGVGRTARAVQCEQPALGLRRGAAAGPAEGGGAAPALSTLRPVDGRFEYVRCERRHHRRGRLRPHARCALENVLRTLGEIRRPGQRMLVVCGCGGDRDRTKRPGWRIIAVKHADTAIFTSDNPAPRTRRPSSTR